MIVSRVFLIASVFGLALLHLLEPTYDLKVKTLSEYVLSPNGWVFTVSILLMALGSALTLHAVWKEWRRRRWLLLMWSGGIAVVALAPTDPGGVVTTFAGAVHAAAAVLAIFALFVSEVSTAFAKRRGGRFAGVCALLVVLGFMLSPLFGFGVGERVIIGSHIAWLLGIGVMDRFGAS